jgi:membrane protein
LNHAWEVKPDPHQGGVRNFIFKRLLSLGMVLGLGFLLAVSLALSAAIASLAGRIVASSATVVL